MYAPHNGRVLTLPSIVAVAVPVAEDAAQHVKNALQMLGFLEQLSPAFYHLNPELARAKRRAEAALVFIEHNGPPKCAACHLRKAIESLLECDVDWEVITEIPVACTRLLAALFQITADA